ncbi:hypothetical protein [Pedobacter sp. MC2016-24]|uniref:hypothetical protein n=1 Tax=Pedobacter sp. MC2016-24 TaxID=2780090 RepID=UPI00187F4504|nr:hypothetical protein [Pedobacter sp. MC2016-24]MBE9599302.1 hypothetical protein [Pedobacter sp. MC2016-24]
MSNNLPCLRHLKIICLISLTVFCDSCTKNSQSNTAYYYWKQNFKLNAAQTELLEKTGNNKLYIRFFDIKWNTKTKLPYPEAIVNFQTTTPGRHITPVIFITNQTFEKLSPAGIDSLVRNSNQLLEQLARKNHIVYQAIQIDCDWTLSTKATYFSFLKQLRTISKKKLEATIRLHQIKYQFKTGVPPVDRGTLMFYNMGKLSADPKTPNSIYNTKDAAAYIGTLNQYLLPLDVALPVFSWSLQIRSGKIIQVYAKIGVAELENKMRYKPTVNENVYEAIDNFFTAGVYVKTGDLFKLEESTPQLLQQAAQQLSTHLNTDTTRTIIYYELGNLNLSAFKAKDFQEISARF